MPGRRLSAVPLLLFEVELIAIWGCVCVCVRVCGVLALYLVAAYGSASVEKRRKWCQPVLRNIAGRERELYANAAWRAPDGPIRASKGTHGGSKWESGRPKWGTNAPLRVPNGRIRGPNCDGEILGPPRWNLRVPRCANKAAEVILGRFLGAQKGPKTGPNWVPKTSRNGNPLWTPFWIQIWFVLGAPSGPKSTKVR